MNIKSFNMSNRILEACDCYTQCFVFVAYRKLLDEPLGL